MSHAKKIDLRSRLPFRRLSVRVGLAVMIILIGGQTAFAHQRQLVTIGGRSYLLVAGSVNEPVYVGDKSGVELFAYTPDPKDPLNDKS